MTIRCVAIDDEPIALNIIQEYCRKYGNIDLRCFTSPVAGMEYVSAVKPDIVFLDIEMNSHNGITLASDIPDGTCLVFTTAYSQYAVDGFNVDAVDFLHKPIFYPRFERAIEKALKWMGRKDEDRRTRRDTITLKVEHKNVIVNTNDIIFIEAMDNYVKVFRKDLPMVMSQITMKEMETLLGADRFIRVHRSYIVALENIERFSNRQIFVHGLDRPIPVGRKYAGSINSLNSFFKLNPTDKL